MERLPREGFRLGVDAYVRLQDLLRSLDAQQREDLDRLPFLLAPLLCHSEAEQARLYQLIAEERQRLDDAGGPGTGEQQAEGDGPVRRGWLLALAGAALLLLALLVWRPWKGRALPPAETPASLRSICLDSAHTGLEVQLRDSLRPYTLDDGQGGRFPLRYGLDTLGYYPDSLALRVLIQDSSGAADTFAVGASICNGNLLPPEFQQTDTKPRSEPEPRPDPVTATQLDTLPVRISDLSELPETEPEAAWRAWLRRYRWPLKLGFILLAAGLAALLRWLRLRRRKLYARQRREDERPPLAWQPGIPAPEVESGDAFALLARDLRRREAADSWSLDLAATLRATLRQGGLIQPRYRQAERPPEYLILIDQHARQNHQARLFNLVYETLLGEAVFAERFYYDGDPRRVWSPEHPEGLGLQELLARYPSHRLLIFGDGARFLSPASGRPQPWTSALAGWERRALLSPRAVAGWGQPELALGQLMLLLPGGPEGLGELIAAWEGRQAADTRSRIQAARSSGTQQPLRLEGDLAAALRSYFGPEHLAWIAACALYPRLHWDLTLSLGSRCMEGRALHYRDLEQIARLPWFEDGRMPDEVRAKLLSAGFLSETQTQALRGHIHELLLQSPPPEGSAAWDDYRMTLLVNRLLTRQLSREERRALEEELRQRLLQGQQADFTLLGYLDRPGPLDFALPPRLRRLVYERGKPFFGLKPWAAGLALGLSAALLALPLPPPASPCAGEAVSAYGRSYCLASDSARLAWLEHHMYPAVQQADTLHLDSLRQAADERLAGSPPLDSLICKTAIAWYNRAIRRYNAGDTAAVRDALTQAGRLACASTQPYAAALSSLLDRDPDCRGSADLSGTVRDSLGQPLAGVSVSLGSAGNVLSDSRGRFLIRGIDTCLLRGALIPPLRLRRGGYLPLDTLWKSWTGSADFMLQKGTPPSADLAVVLSWIEQDMIPITGGHFQMGSKEYDNEKPVHVVQLSGFMLSRYEVTNAQYAAFLNDRGNQEEGGVLWYNTEGPGYNGYADAAIRKENGRWAVKVGWENHPVNHVSWYGAAAFARWAGEKTGRAYRLPTEAEWEYAAGGGLRDRDAEGNLKYSYAGSDNLDEVGWWYTSSTNDTGTRPVGGKQPNGLGLYDMSGNVWEWCSDWYGTYPSEPQTNPIGPVLGAYRVFRGGSWFNRQIACRVANRSHNDPKLHYSALGFRLAL